MLNQGVANQISDEEFEYYDEEDGSDGFYDSQNNSQPQQMLVINQANNQMVGDQQYLGQPQQIQNVQQINSMQPQEIQNYAAIDASGSSSNVLGEGYEILEEELDEDY